MTSGAEKKIPFNFIGGRMLQQISNLQQKKKEEYNTNLVEEQIKLAQKLLNEEGIEKNAMQRISEYLNNFDVYEIFDITIEEFKDLMQKKNVAYNLFWFLRNHFENARKLIRTLLGLFETEITQSETKQNGIPNQDTKILELRKIEYEIQKEEKTLSTYFKEAKKLTHNKFSMGLVNTGIKLFGRALCQTISSHVERIHKTGPVLLAIHHHHVNDLVLLFKASPRRPHFLADAELLDKPPKLEKFSRAMGIMPFFRGHYNQHGAKKLHPSDIETTMKPFQRLYTRLFDGKTQKALSPEEKEKEIDEKVKKLKEKFEDENFTTITKCINLLKHGECVAVFPEGSTVTKPFYDRSDPKFWYNENPNFLNPEKGVALIVKLAHRKGIQNIPVIPIGIRYENNYKRGFFNVGKPLFYENYINNGDTKAFLAKIMEEIYTLSTNDAPT